MAAASSLYPVHRPAHSEDQHVVMHDVPWATYVHMRDSIESASVRMTYLEGTLEIMSPSPAHEEFKTQIARLLELFCLERDIPLFGFGSTTYRKEEKRRGLEPDECYCRDRRAAIPDVAIEVIIAHGAVDKLEVYAGLGVREVWLYLRHAFRALTLNGSAYEPIAKSQVFPELDLTQLARFVPEENQHEALKKFRAELRAER